VTAEVAVVVAEEAAVPAHRVPVPIHVEKRQQQEANG
jgi:hypothetical protein